MFCRCLTIISCQHIVYIEDGIMAKTKHMRAKDLIRRFLNKRPEGESYRDYSMRLKIPFISFGKLERMADVPTGLLYQILKDKGYVLMAYCPNPPEGMDGCYIIDNTYAPVRERPKSKVITRRDPYTGELFRKKRRYKKSEYMKFKKVE